MSSGISRARGYVAIAADYERFIDGAYRRDHVRLALRGGRSRLIVEIARGYAEVDPARIGLLGFSQGGVYSLLIAAHAPEQESGPWSRTTR